MKSDQKRKLQEFEEQTKQNEILTNERIQLSQQVDELQARIKTQTSLFETQKADLIRQQQALASLQEECAEIDPLELTKQEMSKRQAELQRQVHSQELY